jgi:pimeloyl-ACP methyl ester carboxylesterase
MFRSALGLAAFRRSPLAFGGCFFDRALIEGAFRERFVAPLVASAERMQGALQFLRQMRFTRIDAFRELHTRLTLPTLFVWGADDPTFPVARARAMVSQFPKPAGFYEIPRAKLFVYEERPDEVARHLVEFLSG